MASFKIIGGKQLSGNISPQGAKNEALQVISAILLTEKKVIIQKVPIINDVMCLMRILKGLGVKIEKISKNTFSFEAKNIDLKFLNSKSFKELSQQIRGSVMLVGPLVARFGVAKLYPPGGDKIGRTLGYRTANVFLNDCILPLRGVYVTRLYLNQKIYNGISNYGVAPTFGTKKTDVLETHLFSPIKNLYKKNITIEFLKFLRKERKFKSKKNLLDQIKKDITGAKKVFKNAR